MTARVVGLTLALALAVALAAPAGAAPPPQGTQSDAGFAASGAGVRSVSATTQRVSCFAPETLFTPGLTPADGYLDGGATPCAGAATTGEDAGPYAIQDTANAPQLVKDHSESDIRVDPTNPSHLIGQSKWFVNGEGYNHEIGFYESFDGGQSWPTQGHVPGYEGWTDVTDPVGAFDPWGNFYSLLLPYQFYYDKSGGHHFDNGSNQVNPSLPAEAIAVAVRPHGASSPSTWITQHGGHLDFLATSKNANTGDPDKQWITIDTNPASPHYGRVYAMWTLFTLNPSVIFESHADARPDGTHSDWTAPHVLPTVSGKRWDSYLLPHVAPDGSVWTTSTNNPSQQGFANADVSLVFSADGGASWQGPLPVVQGISVPTYQNTTFREGIVNTFAVGTQRVAGAYPLYVSYEDGSSGLSNVYLTASYDAGRSWSPPIRVNDNPGPAEALQPNLDVAPDGTVVDAFYDRRLPCPAQGTSAATKAGVAYDPAQPFGVVNWCVNAAAQLYSPALAPIGHNVRLSPATWDPQLSAPHTSCICSSTTFIGDYFGVDSTARYIYTTSVSTANLAGENPFFHQQQLVSRIATP
jgi:hypothetical protein